MSDASLHPEEERGGGRRILAVVLPQLACELVHNDAERPLGVVQVDSSAAARELLATAPLDAVNEVARRLGLTAGQTIAEARAQVAGLLVRPVSRERILAALQTVAEIALGFGTVVSLQPRKNLGAEGGYGVLDTVWVDITGVAHLFDGERQLMAELLSAVRALGHEAKASVAAGPWLAQALARWGARGGFHELPIVALPLDTERAVWLTRLGVHTWGDLAVFPREATAARLGESASLVLDLCAGLDSTPLVAYRPPRVLIEERSFDTVAEGAVDGVQPLAFVLRGLTARMAARLMGRGEAAQVLVLKLRHDRSIAKLRGVSAQTELHFDLSPPLWRETELYRLIMSRLERAQLGAPTECVRLEVPLITHAIARQLNFLETEGIDELPVLLAELAADIGSERVGVLRVVDSHRPEAQSVLGQAVVRHEKPGKKSVSQARLGQTRVRKKRHKMGQADRELGQEMLWSRGEPGVRSPGYSKGPRVPTRLLARPLPLRAALRVGCPLFFGQRAYTIERISFERRLEGIEWWSHNPTSRDYYRLLLRGADCVVEALVFVDRSTKARFLQGVYD